MSNHWCSQFTTWYSMRFVSYQAQYFTWPILFLPEFRKIKLFSNNRYSETLSLAESKILFPRFCFSRFCAMGHLGQILAFNLADSRIPWIKTGSDTWLGFTWPDAKSVTWISMSEWAMSFIVWSEINFYSLIGEKNMSKEGFISLQSTCLK